MLPRTTPSQSKHCLEFGLEIVSRDKYGNLTHKESWEAYQHCSTSAKMAYFKDKVQSANTLHIHMDLTSETIDYTIKAPIVQTIIGELFFNTEVIEAHSDDEAEEDVASAAFHRIAKLSKQKKHAMLLFKPAELAAEGAASYTVTIKNPMRYHLVIDHVGACISFKQTDLAIGNAKNRAQLLKLAGINDLIVGKFVRVHVAVALQRIADMLSNEDQLWAFSLAGDVSTHRGHSFFDLRLRLYWHGRHLNLHLVALPMFDRHTAENMFNTIAKLMDALFPNWRAKLIGVSRDGENTMTGRHRGLVMRLVSAVEYNVLRVWCAPHQIDIIAKQTPQKDEPLGASRKRA
ncbi:unnamed protein product [Hyaloperonospora brassicae]|uniref:DUF4371 domain-containing protein n=1 Tax=Hyaloperonospora brassicae TaxID=162125 RepID=A0AAV0T8R3_HYABA|nr:unnamed protein product [Hyaloperonospora brassicae]